MVSQAKGWATTGPVWVLACQLSRPREIVVASLSAKAPLPGGQVEGWTARVRLSVVGSESSYGPRKPHYAACGSARSEAKPQGPLPTSDDRRALCVMQAASETGFS